MSAQARVVLGLFAVSLFAALASGRTLLFSLAYLWGALLAGSWVWARVSVSGLSLHRKPRALRAQVGHLFVERLSLRNDSWLPKLWLDVRDHSELPGSWAPTFLAGILSSGSMSKPGHRASAVLGGVAAHETRSWVVRTLCTRRGRFRIGPAEACSGDPFGLFTRCVGLPQSYHVVVLPTIVALSRVPLPGGRLPGGEALRGSTHQVTPNAAGVRDYAPGDSMSRIHWRSTARRGRLIVKEFERDPMTEVWIVLDGARSVHVEHAVDDLSLSLGLAERWAETRLPLPPSTEEYAVTLAASLAFYFYQRDRAVGLVAYGQVRQVLQADRGEAQLNRILESLAVFQAAGSVSLIHALRIEGDRLPRGSTVYLITPAVNDELLVEAREMHRAGLWPVLILLDRSTFGGSGNPARLAAAARREGYPTSTIGYGASLRASLEEAAIGGREPRILRSA